MKRFKLSEIQANYILDMPLRRLTRLIAQRARGRAQGAAGDHQAAEGAAQGPQDDPGRGQGRAAGAQKKFGDARRTEIRADEGDVRRRGPHPGKDVIVTITRAGYVKRLPVETYRRQGRGGRGVIGANLKADDIITQVFTTTTHHWLLVFTNKGKVYRTKVHEVPEGSRTGPGDLRREPAGDGIRRRRADRLGHRHQGLRRREVPGVRHARRASSRRPRLSEYDSARSGWPPSTCARATS